MLRDEQQERLLRCPRRAGPGGAPVDLRLQQLSNHTREEDGEVDDQAWTETRQRLRAFVSARLAPAAAVDDVVQEVLAKMVEHLDDLADTTKIEAWVYRIARNAITDEYRRRGRHAAVVTRLTDVPAPPQPPVDDTVLAADLVELAGCLRPLADNLDAPYRDALILTSWGGLTQAQAAERAGLTLPGMKSRIRRGRAQLREQLLACCQPESSHDGLRGRPGKHSCAVTTKPNGCGCRHQSGPTS